MWAGKSRDERRGQESYIDHSPLVSLCSSNGGTVTTGLNSAVLRSDMMPFVHAYVRYIHTNSLKAVGCLYFIYLKLTVTVSSAYCSVTNGLLDACQSTHEHICLCTCTHSQKKYIPRFSELWYKKYIRCWVLCRCLLNIFNNRLIRTMIFITYVVTTNNWVWVHCFL